MLLEDEVRSVEAEFVGTQQIVASPTRTLRPHVRIAHLELSDQLERLACNAVLRERNRAVGHFHIAQAPLRSAEHGHAAYRLLHEFYGAIDGA
jgi:hypothetical protein